MGVAANSRSQSILTQFVIVSLFSAVTVVFLFLFAVARPVVGATLLVALMVPLATLLSGNARLFFLIGLVLTVPLDLSKQFNPMPHFGGEIALRIEAVDLFLIGLYVFWLHDLYWGKPGRFRMPSILVCWLMLAVIGWASILISPVPTVVVYEGVRMLKMLALAFLLANVIVRRQQVEYVVLALMAGGLIQILYAYAQYFLGFSIGLQHLGELEVPISEQLGLGSTSRIGAMIGHPNIFAAYLVLVCSLAFALMFSQCAPWKKALYVAVALGGTGALVLTLARAGWLGLAVSLLVIGAVTCLHPRLRDRNVMLRVFVIVSLLVICLAGSGYMIRKITMADAGGWPARVAFMNMGLEMIKTHPVTGVGLNTYMYVVEEYDFSGIDWGDSLSAAHNIFILVWAEQGTLGLILFASMIVLVLKTAVRNLACRDNFLLLTSLGVLGGLCGVIVQGQLDFNFKMTSIQRVFFTMTALVIAVRYWIEENENTAK